ncbi:DNA-binding protein [Methylorubrum extorquens]|uniref:DNA-binding protein n=1 Tax=Methylorubrum extorquens TaxID=408 RepID=UPI000158EFD1|nr:DNA-binding protein [Methylorubrum extorquens]ABY30317.1 hypothetical protein Mext_1918 [Methylorubrum extorquens PA1]KQP89295.1 hypothetical protein ASF55_04050 [Methylobacterium sp. Leaf119]WIU41608.1 DNA-binding protein [Methylorubrum extorquens]
MVAVNPVWQAADRIRARPAGQDGRKERVSVRSVRKELGKGSFSDIARELKVWREREDYHPVIEQADLPEAFERRLTVLGRELLEMARVEVARATLADFAGSERRRSAERDLLDEAFDRVDFLEERVAALQAELDRRPAGTGRGQAAPAQGAPAAEPEREWKGSPFADMAQGISLAKRADVFWEQVRIAVEDVFRRRGPLAVHPLFKSLPKQLKQDGEQVGFPLTEGWLRYHLLHLVQGGGLALDGYRFGLAEPAPGPDDGPAVDASAADDAAAMGRRRFWRQYMLDVHDLLVKEGPMTVAGIIDGMGPGWVEASERYRKITVGRIRYKLRGRIVEGRPFVELADGRFAAVPVEGHWDGLSAARTAEGNG